MSGAVLGLFLAQRNDELCERCVFHLLAIENRADRFAIQPRFLRGFSQSTRSDLGHQSFISGDPPSVIMNTNIVDILDEVVFTLFEPRNLFTNAVLQAAFDRHPLQQASRMSSAFLSIRPVRFNLSVLDVTAQNIAQRDDVGSREFVQTIVFPVVRVHA